MGTANFDKQLRALQIIVGGLILGASIFLIISLSVPPSESKHEIPSVGGVSILIVIGLFMLITTQIATRAMLNWIMSSARKKIAAGTWRPNPVVHGFTTPTQDLSDPSGMLFVLFQQRTIFTAASMEGPAMWFGITYLMDRNPIAIGIAVLSIIGVAFQMPTKSKMQDWIGAQLELIDQLKQRIT